MQARNQFCNIIELTQWRFYVGATKSAAPPPPSLMACPPPPPVVLPKFLFAQAVLIKFNLVELNVLTAVG